jgi:excisionase family DNA binding protein
MNSGFDILFDDIFGVKELANYLNLSVNTVRQYVSNGKLPKADVKKSGNPLWHVDTITAWKENQNAN